MKIIQQFATKNPCYKKAILINPKGLMLHSVGCPQSSAKVFVKNWNTSSHSVCVHAFVDANDGDIYQILPWNYRASHCGGAANNTHIGVEMCEPYNIKYTGGSNFTCSDLTKAREMAVRAYNSAVFLFSELCRDYKLDPLEDGVIISHYEGGKRKVASGHADPEHLWKGLGLTAYTMDSFRKDVARKMKKEEFIVEEIYRVRKTWSDSKSQIGAYSLLANAKQAADSNPGYSVFDKDGNKVYPQSEQKVQITVSDLRIRKGPGTGYASFGTTGKGVFTIVEVQNGSGSASGWGLLKSHQSGRDGWISMDYAKIL